MLKKILLGGLGGTAALWAGYKGYKKIKEYFDEKELRENSSDARISSDATELEYDKEKEAAKLNKLYRNYLGTMPNENVSVKTEAELEELQQNALLNTEWIKDIVQENKDKIVYFKGKIKKIEDFQASPYLLCQNFANGNLALWLEKRGYEDKLEKIAQIPTQATRIEVIKALWQVLYDESPKWLDFVAENDVRWHTLKKEFVRASFEFPKQLFANGCLIHPMPFPKIPLIKEKASDEEYKDLLESLLTKLDNDLNSQMEKFVEEDENISFAIPSISFKIMTMRMKFGFAQMRYQTANFASEIEEIL